MGTLGRHLLTLAVELAGDGQLLRPALAALEEAAMLGLMSPDEIVRAFIAAIEAKDVDGALAYADESISYENMPISPIVGLDGLAKTLRGFLAAAEDVDWVIINQWTVGRTVINERLDRFKVGDGWLELPVAGFFEVGDDDKITLWRDYFDMGSYTSQLAHLSEPII